MNTFGLSSSVRIAYVTRYWKFFIFNYIRVQVLCQSRLRRADHAHFNHLMLQNSLINWTVVSLTTTSKFKPIIFFMSGFALSYTTNMFILMILYDFCLLPAQFCYIIVYTGKVESCVQIADRCAPWKISNGAENLILQIAVLRGRCLPLIPRRGKHKSLLI
jgi:hypothetical protein